MDKISKNYNNDAITVFKKSLPADKVLGNSLLSGGCIPINEAIIKNSSEKRAVFVYQTANDLWFSLPDYLFVLIIEDNTVNFVLKVIFLNQNTSE